MFSKRVEHTSAASMVLMIAISLAAGSFLAQKLDTAGVRAYWERTGSMAEEASQIEEGSVAALLWEMRTGAGDMLWLKTDEYMHDGLSHAGCSHDHGDEEQQEGLMGHELEESETGHNHESEDHFHEDIATAAETSTEHHEANGIAAGNQKRKRVQFIREARPWQGILGKVSELTDTVGKHRITKRKEELLPWFRIVTLMNPHHVRAYRTGAFWLALEGLRNNPDDPEMQFIVGRIYFYNLHDPQAALPYFQETIRTGQRIPVEERADTQGQAIVDGYRHVAYCHKEMGNVSLAKSAILKGLKMWPRDKAMQDYLKTLENSQAIVIPVSKA